MGRGIVGLLVLGLAFVPAAPGEAAESAESAEAARGELRVTTTVLPLLDETGADAYGLATAINNRGVVVGRSGQWPVLWRRGEVVALTGEQPADGGLAAAVNERGEVIVRRTGQPLSRWFRGRITDLDLGPDSRLWQLGGFNDRGQALVYKWVARGAELGIWEPDGSFTPVAIPEGYSAEQPVGLSDAGHVAGNFAPLDGFAQRPFVWKDGTLTVLAEWGFARDVNRWGQVAGVVFDPDDPGRWPVGRATVWAGGEETPVVPDSVRFSSVEDINDRGQVVGAWSTASGASHAYLWDGGELTDLVPPGNPALNPQRVNERGQVVGYVTLPGVYNFRGFFWDGGDLVELGPGLGPSHLNDRGQALGRALVDGQERPVLWEVRRT